MNTNQLPEERECPRCHGRGTVELPKGAASSAPAWSAEEGRAKCGMCKGRGFVIKQAARQKGGFFRAEGENGRTGERETKANRLIGKSVVDILAEQEAGKTQRIRDSVDALVAVPSEIEPADDEQLDDDQVGEEPFVVPEQTYDPDSEKRRIFCLEKAMLLVGVEHHTFGGTTKSMGDLAPGEVVGVAREMDRFLRGD